MLLIATLVGLVLAELVLRVFSLSPSEGLGTVTQREFEEVPGLYSPAQKLVDRRKPDLAHTVTINRLGYRGKEISDDPSSIAYRIVVLGDSFTFGDFVDDDQTLPAKLEFQLARRCGGVEVINAGVPGSGIHTQAAMFGRSLALRPDHVVLIFTANDITDLIRPTSWERLAANRRAKSRIPLSLLYPTIRKTALWNLLLKARAQMRNREIARPPEREQQMEHARRDVADSVVGSTEGEATTKTEPASVRPERQALRQEYIDNLLSLHQRAEELGLAFHFAVFPSHHGIGNRRLEVETWIIEAARRAGVPTVDLLPGLRETELPEDSLFLLPRDGHPSPAGYAAAALALQKDLASNSGLPGCSAE